MRSRYNRTDTKQSVTLIVFIDTNMSGDNSLHRDPLSRGIQVKYTYIRRIFEIDFLEEPCTNKFHFSFSIYSFHVESRGIPRTRRDSSSILLEAEFFLSLSSLLLNTGSARGDGENFPEISLRFRLNRPLSRAENRTVVKQSWGGIASRD